MVVGVLALLAIIGVVYATIGRGDRVTSATIQKKQRVNDQVDEVAAYLAGVIGDATFAVYPEITGSLDPHDSSDHFIRTRGYTSPNTDSFFQSVLPGSTSLPAGLTDPSVSDPNRRSLYSVFNPLGSCINIPTGTARTNIRDTRSHGDPYVAALEPECLLAPNGTPYAQLVAGTTAASFANRHDWRTLSNFGPSGNPVNLAVLRSSRGGFNAEPGFGRTAAGRPRMSFGLTLFDRITGRPQSAPDERRNPNQNVALPYPPGDPRAGNANPLVPAHWCTDQVWAFRPNIPDQLTSNNDSINPASYEYLPNFMADADGDGMVDSRWYELVDVSGAYIINPAIINKVPTRGRTRLFIAARCIDSSAMINANTAGDMFFSPLSVNPLDKTQSRDSALPLGITAGDNDLRRLLAMSDLVEQQRNAGLPVAALGLAGLPTPEANSIASVVADYAMGPNPYNVQGASAVGAFAYTAAFDARLRGSSRTTAIQTLRALNTSERNLDYARFAASGHSLGVTNLSPLGNIRYTGTPFDLSDELELRAFFGLNDSDTLSRLEASIGGRTPTTGPSALAAQYQGYSPLRDNRPRSLEMKWRDELEPDKFFSGYMVNDPTNPNRQAILSIFSDVRHLLTTVNGARPMKSSGVAPDLKFTNDVARGLVPDVFGASTDITAALQAIINYGSFDRAPTKGDPDRYVHSAYPAHALALNPAGQPVPSTPAVTPDKPSFEDWDNYDKAVKLIFRLYLNALAPYTDESYTDINGNIYYGHFPGAWDTNANTLEYRQGLVYGGSPELAIRMAAHMTANFVDAFDRERKLNANGLGRPYVDTTTGVPFENLGLDRGEPTVLSVDLAKVTNSNQAGPGYKEPGRNSHNRQLVNAYEGVKVMEPLKDPRFTAVAAGTPGTTPGTALGLCNDITTQLPSYKPYTGGGYKVSGKMNIFGIEPQPFITEISSFAVYTSKSGTGGGPGGSSGGNGAGFAAQPADIPVDINIEYNPDVTNKSFIGEFIAIQLNNPFDDDVVLYDPKYGPNDAEGDGAPTVNGTARMDRFRFYFEYAGRYYAFAPAAKQIIHGGSTGDHVGFDAETTSTTSAASKRDPVILHAGETRTFYICNPGTLEEVANRVNEATGSTSGAAGAFDADAIEKWLAGNWTSGNPGGSGQLFIFGANSFTYTAPQTNQSDALVGNPQKPQQLVQVYPTTFKAVQPSQITGGNATKVYMDIWGEHDASGTGNYDHVYGSQIATDSNRRVAHLWRVIRSHSSLTTNASGIQGDLVDGTTGVNTDINLNDVTNDLLVDRIHDPGTNGNATLLKNHMSLGTISWHSVPSSEPEIPPNTLSAIVWNAVRRPTDVDANIANAVPSGGTLINGKHSARGVLPPWCLEVKADEDTSSGTPWTWTGSRSGNDFSMNQAQKDFQPSASDLHDYHNYLHDDHGGYKSLTALLRTTKQVNSEIGKPCAKKVGNQIKDLQPLGFPSASIGVNRHYSDVAVEFYNVGEDRLGGVGGRTGDKTETVLVGNKNINAAYRRSRNPALFTRAGDFLLPLAIGPWFDPSRDSQAVITQIPWLTTGANDQLIADREVQWMTTSEALALASGYYGPKVAVDPALAEFARLNPASNHLPMTDRGHLALDRFVPYLRTTSGASLFQPGVFQPLGSGVPFALGIIDQFRAAGGISSTPKRTSADSNSPWALDLSPPLAPDLIPTPVALSRWITPESQISTMGFGSTSLSLSLPQTVVNLALVPGTLNVNTLPWSTICALPLVRPTNGDVPWAFASAQAYEPVPPATAGSQLFQAGTQPAIKPKPNTGIDPGFYDLSQVMIDYRNGAYAIRDPVHNHNPFWNGSLRTVNYPTTPFGGVISLPTRQEKGIASFGELAFINLYDNTAGANFGAIDPTRSMFHFAAPDGTDVTGPDPAVTGSGTTMHGTRLSFHQELASAGSYDHRDDGRIETSAGGSAFVQGNTPPAGARTHYDAADTAPPIQRVGTSQLINNPNATNYQDKLAIINALANTASIRSDIFTVYFLIHAYTPEDCDIPDDQPMVPTVAKRYVMVVDRSNVNVPGVKPRILMLKEVPMP
jgi:hypothetical protein